MWFPCYSSKVLQLFVTKVVAHWTWNKVSLIINHGYILNYWKQGRAANNARSMDNVRSELGIDRTNPWIAGHFVWFFTDSFREILIFNYCKSYDC